jgi:hypothetical protein
MNTLFNYIKDDSPQGYKEYSAKNEILEIWRSSISLWTTTTTRKLIDKKMEAIYSIIDRMDNIHKLYTMNPAVAER